MGQDIGRFLRREPIEARTPSLWACSVRAIARHPLLVTNALWIGLSVVIAATVFLTIVFHINARPHAIRGGSDEPTASLMSVIGGVLHTWEAGINGRITFAALVDRPARLGGGKLAVLAWSNAQSSPFAGRLCAFDLDGDLDVPIWTKRIETSYIPDTLRDSGAVPGEFEVTYASVADIFPEERSPGSEIIAIHKRGAHSQCVIRIYDLRGAVLYEAWQDGGVDSCHWMPGPGLIVAAGLNAEVYWEDRGKPDVADPYPRVIFAIRPELGFRTKTFLGSTSSESPGRPVWYRCVLPPESMDKEDRHAVNPAHGRHSPARYAAVAITGRGAGVEWIIDEHGNEVMCTDQDGNQQRCTLLVSDGYKRDQASAAPKFPPPDTFYLGELPPIVKSTPAATSDSSD
ncbi:MAG: hypothetical protein IID36_04890 [Planctomycetes bacterium]|nr:hypothetical protein [Planctomycetota bacterium]